ncbi:MAG TPA: hypothetical protein VJ547_09355, partial [Candidatus Thermoplasmatota archaeon]|nr:hypothetical protein [Candidatus Thermoplasmatota archaeon]
MKKEVTPHSMQGTSSRRLLELGTRAAWSALLRIGTCPAPPQMSYALGRLVDEGKLARRSEGRAAFYCIPGTPAAEAASKMPTGS